MPRYVLHFYKTRKDLVNGTVSEMAGADDFTEALIEALREIGNYEEVMIIQLRGPQVEDYKVVHLEEIADLLRDWHRDGVFETL